MQKERQHDAPEFVNALIRKNSQLQEEIEFYEFHEIKCDHCGHVNRNSNLSRILQLPVSLNEQSITNMIKNYSSWNYPEGLKCELC